MAHRDAPKDYWRNKYEENINKIGLAGNENDGNYVFNTIYNNMDTPCICYRIYSDKDIIEDINTMDDSIKYMVNSFWVDEAIEFDKWIIKRIDNGIMWVMIDKETGQNISFYRFVLEKIYYDHLAK
jgi:hypothetical protein